LYPGAGFICLAIEAMTQITSIEAETLDMAQTPSTKEIAGYRLRDIDILQALVVPDNADGIEIQTVLRPVSDKTIGVKGWKHFEVFSVTVDNQWAQHAKGLIMAEFDTSADGPPVKFDMKRKNIRGYARRIDPNDMFAGLRSVGINHGPIFQNMKSIVQSGKEKRSVSTFVVADTTVPNDLPRHHVLHPTTLDSVVQAAYTALPGAGSRQDSPRVPRSIEKLWVSSHISHDAGHIFKAYSSLSRADAQSIQANISLTTDDGDDGGDADDTATPMLEIQGLLCQSLGRSAVPEQAKEWGKEVCSNIEWAPDMSLALPATLESIKKQLSRTVDPDESRIIMDLRRVCIYFIQDALAALTISDVDQLDVHHVKFYTWMQDQLQLASLGLLGPGSAEWALDRVSERELRIDLATKASVNGEMVCHLGPHLADMLRHTKAPLELMMEEKLLYRYYGEALKSERCFSQVASLLRQVVHKNPRARILEVRTSLFIEFLFFNFYILPYCLIQFKNPNLLNAPE